MSDIDKVKDDFERHHAIVKKGLATAFDVAISLQNIRDEKLYRAAGYRTFKDYCSTEHGFTDRNARHMIAGGEVAKTHDVPNMTAARKLADVPEDRRAEVLSIARERMGGKVTSTMIEDVHHEVLGEPQMPHDDEFKEIVSDFMRIGGKIRALSEKNQGCYLDLDQIRAGMQTAMDFVKAAVPARVCICMGVGCKACHNLGHITETMYKALPEEMRAT